MFEAQMAFHGMHPSFFSSNFMLPNEVITFNSPLFNSNVPQHLEVEGVGAMVWRKDGEEHNGDDDFSDDCSPGSGEKKRRLSVEQVTTLEKNFEFGNKLDPERKIQLARALGLQPRQIAIWFQNRRARWKTKQLEKDYDILKHLLDEAKSENLALQAENHKLQAEIFALKGMEVAEAINNNAIKDNEGSCSNTSDYTSEIHNLGIMSRTMSSIDTSLDANQSISSLFLSSNKTHELKLCSKIEEEEEAEEIVLPDENFANMLSIIDDDRDGSVFFP